MIFGPGTAETRRGEGTVFNGGCRLLSQLLLAVLFILSIAATEAPSPRKDLPPAEGLKQGHALITELLSQRPAQSTAKSGVLKIWPAKASRREVPIRFEIKANATQWTSVYHAGPAGPGGETLTVVHDDGRPNAYTLEQGPVRRTPAANGTMIPFAGSDFWVADLGLEFFHWPEQRLLRTEMRRSRSCRVLESLNPHPAPGAYARVVSWIDIESYGIVVAEAYDARNKLLKEFLPKGVKKVNGRWELESMEIINDQTGSRTWIEFDLPEKSR